VEYLTYKCNESGNYNFTMSSVHFIVQVREIASRAKVIIDHLTINFPKTRLFAQEHRNWWYGAILTRRQIMDLRSFQSIH
jgi:hypothetical protein